VNAVPEFLAHDFVGRSSELNKIESAFDEDGITYPKRCVIFGTYGLGKTQLALKYADLAYREKRYPYVFWVTASTSQSLLSGFTRIHDLVVFPPKVGEENMLLAACSWLYDPPPGNSQKWLLILDKSDPLEVVTPRSRHRP